MVYSDHICDFCKIRIRFNDLKFHPNPREPKTVFHKKCYGKYTQNKKLTESSIFKVKEV